MRVRCSPLAGARTRLPWEEKLSCPLRVSLGMSISHDPRCGALGEYGRRLGAGVHLDTRSMAACKVDERELRRIGIPISRRQLHAAVSRDQDEPRPDRQSGDRPGAQGYLRSFAPVQVHRRLEVRPTASSNWRVIFGISGPPEPAFRSWLGRARFSVAPEERPSTQFEGCLIPKYPWFVAIRSGRRQLARGCRGRFADRPRAATTSRARPPSIIASCINGSRSSARR
jgi:hypothetical protein